MPFPASEAALVFLKMYMSWACGEGGSAPEMVLFWPEAKKSNVNVITQCAIKMFKYV